jgi:hypothetical protein
VAEREGIARVVAALCYGERVAGFRAAEAAALAPDARGRQHQEQVAAKERHSAELLEYRLAEIGSPDQQDAFRPFFDAFFERTIPEDWVEAQTFHYVGDAMVRDFAEVLVPTLDPISAELVRSALSDRDGQEAFALDELTRRMEEEPAARERVAAYARRIIGEALTQTRRALDETDALGQLLGGADQEKRMLLEVLERHRVRLDRLGIESVDEPQEEQE